MTAGRGTSAGPSLAAAPARASDTIYPERAVAVYLDLTPGAAQLVLVGGQRNREFALTLNLELPAQGGTTTREVLRRAFLAAERRDGAPSPASHSAQPLTVNVAPPAVTVNVDMAGLREVASSRGSMTVRRDQNGMIEGTDFSAASVADTARTP